MKGHIKSCSCTSCAYRSQSKRPSVQHLLDEGTKIDRLFYGKYLPLRERKLLEKLIRTRAAYDDVRDKLLSSSGSSEDTRSEYTFHSQGDDSIAKSRTISKLVSLVDRGQIRSSNAILSSCCNCCSCSSLKKIKKDMKKHPIVYKKPDVPYENIAKYKVKAEKRARSKRKRIGSKIKDVRFKSRTIYSEACLCPKSLVDMIKHSSKMFSTKLESDEVATISVESSASYTEGRTKAKRKSFLKKDKRRKSIGSETPKRFPIKKDSLSLYRDKMRRKHARKKVKDKNYDTCDPEICKHMKHKIRKKHGKDDLKVKPGVCHPEDCDPIKCGHIHEEVRTTPILEDWECEPGVCIPDECDPEVCYKRIIARRGGNIKKRKGRHKISGASKANLSGASKANLSMLAKPLVKSKTSKTETKVVKAKSVTSKHLKTVKHSSSQSRSSLSIKKTQIEHSLKRCFCTLKLQKRKQHLKRNKSIKTMASLSIPSREKIARVRKTQTKSAGIAYVVPPMGKAARKLLPYECEPFVCVPGECDPYVCEKRIQARYRKEVHEEGSQIYKKVIRKDNKGIKVHKPRVHYTRSQTVKTEKTKHTHTTPFLRRCLCTLKLFNKDKNKATSVTPSGKPPKPRTSKLRHKYSEASISPKPSVIKKSKTEISSADLQIESYAREKKITKKTDSRIKGIDVLSSPTKQAVRIGSSFSFNIEFFKERIPSNSDEVSEAMKVRKNPRDKTLHERKKTRKVSSKVGVSPVSNKDLGYKAVTSEVKEKGIFVGSPTPTCFCTLRLEKKGKFSKTGDHGYETSKGTETTLELYGPKNTSECKSTSTSKSLRYDLNSFCIPATCDAYESYEEIKRKEIIRLRNRDIATEKVKRKSTTSMTYNGMSGSFKARGAQSYVAKHVPLKAKQTNKTVRQAVRIGSNFSFNIDFYKDRHNIIASDFIFNGRKRHKDLRNSLDDTRSQASSLAEKGDKTVTVGHKLKRCLCTLKFQKKGNVNKTNNQNYQWFRPVTTQFMHIGSLHNDPDRKNTYFDNVGGEKTCHAIESTANKLEKPSDKDVSGMDLLNSVTKIAHVMSSIEFNIETEKHDATTTKFRQHNQFQVGFLLNSNETHMLNNQFHRSYCALNLKVSQVRGREPQIGHCNPSTCKFIDKFRPTKHIGTDNIEMRDSTSTTRQKTRRSAVSTGLSKSQIIQNRREKRKNKQYFNPGKRVTHIGSSINYNLKFYKDTNSKVYTSKQKSAPDVNDRRKSAYRNSHYDDAAQLNKYSSMLRKCICSLATRNNRRGAKSDRSINIQHDRRKARNLYSNTAVRKSRGSIRNNYKSKENKKLQDDCDPGECIKIKQKLLKKGIEERSAGDATDISRKSRLITYRGHKDKTKQEHYKRLLDECDPQECIKFMQKIVEKKRTQNSAGDHIAVSSRKSIFKPTKNDTTNVRNDDSKIKKHKRPRDGCDPQECRHIIQKVLRRNRARESVDDDHVSYKNKRRDFSPYKDVADSTHRFMSKNKYSSGKCDPQDCERKLEQMGKGRRKRQRFADDDDGDDGRQSRFKSFRTDRAARLARSKYTPEIPSDLQKIMMRPPRSDVVKYGSTFSINVEFFKDSASDLYPLSSKPNKQYEEPQDSPSYSKRQRMYSRVARPRLSRHYGETGSSSDIIRNRSSVRSIKTGTKVRDEMSTVSQILKKCVCTLKALNKARSKKTVKSEDHGDGPDKKDETKFDIDKKMCKCKFPHHKCKCKLEHHTCKCKLPNHKCKCKLENHTCKCKLEHHTCKCKLKHHTCKCRNNICQCAKYAKHRCLCKTDLDEKEPDSLSKASKHKEGPETFMQKCFCKLRNLHDRRSLELKPSIETIPSEAKRIRFGHKEIYRPRSYDSEHDTDMDTIMPYSKKKFKKHQSRSKISEGPCGVCPESVCPDCDSGSRSRRGKMFDRSRSRRGKETGGSRSRRVKMTESIQKETKEPDKLNQTLIDKKQICFKVPICNIKALLKFIPTFNKSKPAEEEVRQMPLEPLFDMIVDSHTMSVRNKDDILRDLLSGEIKTKDYGYEEFEDGAIEQDVSRHRTTDTSKKKTTHRDTTDHGLTIMRGDTRAPVLEIDGQQPHKRGKGKKKAKKKQKHKKGPKAPLPRHPKGCKCCDCRKTGKKKKKEQMTEKAVTSGRMKKVKPCHCGTSICARETERLKQMHGLASTNVKTKACVCGSDECRRQAKMEANDLKLYLKKKQEEKIYKAKARMERIQQYQKEDEKIRKERKKKDNAALRKLKFNKKGNDLVLLVESALDVAKFGRTHTCGMIRSLTRTVSHPGDAWFRFKRGAKDPGRAFNNIMDIIFKHSGISRLGARIKERLAGMRATKIVVAEMETHPFTHSLVHAGSKRKPPVKRANTPIDFNCSPYMGSLRQKPCLWIYYLCPWFYPHCISCLGIWRQFTDILLFILAISVWSPCILGMEIARGLMCCLVCTA